MVLKEDPFNNYNNNRDNISLCFTQLQMSDMHPSLYGLTTYPLQRTASEMARIE